MDNDKNYLREAISGTENYHAVMTLAVHAALQRRAGYIPQVINAPAILPPVKESLLRQVDSIMQALTRDMSVRNCNPRSPYLVLAWILIGSNTPYIFCQNIVSNTIELLIQKTASVCLRAAMGDGFYMEEVETIADKVSEFRIEQPQEWSSFGTYKAAQVITDVANVLVTTNYKNGSGRYARDATTHSGYAMLRIAIHQQAKRWAYISDSQAIIILRKLGFDILARTQSSSLRNAK